MSSNIASYDWVNFVLVHVFTAGYWLPFLLNNPLDFPWVFSTLDAPASAILPAGKCTPIIYDNVVLDIGLWLIWWGQHSIMSREAFKRLIGTWGSPIDRPLFGFASCISLPIYTIFWKPITDCTRTDFTDSAVYLSPRVLVQFLIVLICVTFVVSYFVVLPTHVFGTDHYIVYKPGSRPKHGIITGFPYGIVRHPAAAGFLWAFWSIPSYTPSHIFYAIQWSIFIVIGTLVFEEGGLKRDDEFGKQYAKYKSQVSAFIPRLGYFTGEKIRLD